MARDDDGFITADDYKDAFLACAAPTVARQQCGQLDEKALEAATDEIPVYVKREARKEIAETIVRAYLEAATPPDVAGLVERLEKAKWAITNGKKPDWDAAERAIEQAATALRLSAGGGWRTMESAPKDGQSFMVYVAESDMGPHCFAPVSRDTGGDWWDDSTGDCIEPIKGATHWQPLPASPTVEAGHE